MAFMSGAICLMRMPMPRNGGQRLIQRRRPCEVLVPPRNCRRTLGLFMRALHLQSWLRRHGQAAAVHGFQDFVCATPQQPFAGSVAQLRGILEIAVARVAKEL